MMLLKCLVEVNAEEIYKCVAVSSPECRTEDMKDMGTADRSFENVLQLKYLEMTVQIKI
jgi:hypothetical protein